MPPFIAKLIFAVSSLANIMSEQPQGGPLAKVVTSCVMPNMVALTFDDGPYLHSNHVSNLLTAAGAKGTFFFNGNFSACIYDADAIQRVKFVYGQGHQICSHSWSHPDLTTLPLDQINEEMWLIDLALSRIIGVIPAFMRPPFGYYNDLVQQAAYTRNQSLALWDFYTEDAEDDPITTEELKVAYDKLIASHPHNVLALNHETKENVAYEVIPYAIKELQKAGYELVTLAECTGLPAYQNVASPGVPDSSWVC